MGLEVGSFVNDLVTTNPLATDLVGQGDDHLRLLKACVQATFPQMGAALGTVRSQDASASILSTWNTNVLLVTNSSTTTTLLTLPANASVTSGYYIDINTLATGTVTLTPATGSINGAANFSIPSGTFARAFYQGANVWRAVQIPNGLALATFPTNVFVGGTLSVSGAACLSTTLSVSGNASFGANVTISGAANLLTTLSVSGAANFAGAVTISGAAVFKSGITVSGVAVIAGALSVSGASVFAGVTVAGIMTVSGAAVFNSGITVSGAAVIAGALSVSGATVLGGGVTLNSTLNVLGATTLSAAVTLGTTLNVLGAATISGALSLTVGQINFPAAQVASAGANTLDDYEEGTYTPTLAFGSAGNTVLVYSTQTGSYTKVGRSVCAKAFVITTTFTHTTASGSLFCSTPFAASSSGFGAAEQQGLSYAANTYSMVVQTTGSNVQFQTVGLIAATAIATISTANHASGDNVIIAFTVTYDV